MTKFAITKKLAYVNVLNQLHSLVRFQLIPIFKSKKEQRETKGLV